MKRKIIFLLISLIFSLSIAMLSSCDAVSGMLGNSNGNSSEQSGTGNNNSPGDTNDKEDTNTDNSTNDSNNENDNIASNGSGNTENSGNSNTDNNENGSIDGPDDTDKELTVSFDNENVLDLTVGQTTFIPFTTNADESEIEYSVSASEEDYANVRMTSSGKLVVTGIKAGVAKVKITVKTTFEPIQTVTIEKDVVIKPVTLKIEGSANSYGIEGLLTLGKDAYSYDKPGNPSLVDNFGLKSAFSINYLATDADGKDAYGDNFKSYFRWVSSHPDAVSIDENGKIHILDESFLDIVEFRGELFYGDKVYMTTEAMKIRCVGNAVNVYSYRDLWYATEGGFPVVLHNDIKEDFGYIGGEAMYNEIHTTYDDTYYKNMGIEDEARVKVLISFRASVYGNGHKINADNLSNMLEADALGNKRPTEDAIFKGPLNFVMATHGEGANRSTISVKGQDNICFALYDGVTVNNVELIGCDVDAIGGGTSYDLADLAYAGTVAEVLGDNVTIEYSRLTNGRTVLRAFGDINDDTKKIHVSIKNSILSGAREFIMRIGSNRFKTTNEVSPYLDGDDSIKKEYNTKATYNELSDEAKAAYDAKYINTFVTLRDSVFLNAGLFAIGMDSHFAGRALADGPNVAEDFPQLDGLLEGWYDLAKTSYGAKVKFEENVELYSWKEVNAVDSSTLIEVTGNHRIFENMAFDVREMIDRISGISGYEHIVTNYNYKKMFHAGIQFFGGGKNYSVFEYGSREPLYPYCISFSDIGREELTYLAGEEPFYFFLYDSNSSFSPAVQEQKLYDGSAFDCIKP